MIPVTMCDKDSNIILVAKQLKIFRMSLVTTISIFDVVIEVHYLSSIGFWEMALYLSCRRQRTIACSGTTLLLTL